MGKNIYFTVGPSQLYPTVRKHILEALDNDILSISHRSLKFKEIFKTAQGNLRKLLNIPDSHQVLFLSSALEAMERVTQGVVANTSFHIITGSFGKTWFNIAKNLGKTPLKIEAEAGDGVDLSKLKIPKEAEVICITQNDTSFGVAIPMEDIYKLRDRYPKKLVAIDIVSSAPFLGIDFSKIDIAFFSVQKGFGMPAGLGVLIISPQALKKAQKITKKGISIGSFHSLTALSEKAKQYQTPETPNVLNIFLLSKITEDFLKLGIKRLRKETEEKAELIYNFAKTHPNFNPFVKEKKYYSKTTIVIDVKGQSKMILEKLKQKGFIVGSGYGSLKEDHIRIANFPSHKLADIKTLLSSF